jgi:hypothetical protein
MMNAKLKGVIIGDRNVIQNGEYFEETKKLIGFLIKKNIIPIILSNDLKPERIELERSLKREYSEVIWYIADRDSTPKKPKVDAVAYVLDKMGWDKNEVLYIGNTNIDMQTAVNGNLLFLNATWYAQTNYYGFEFASPKDVARFIDIFCLRKHFWNFAINHQNLEYYALGIYGTREEKYSIYSNDAREAAKFGRGHPDFWIKYLLSAVYFSGLHERIDYIAPYPGHQQGSTTTVMEETLVAFAKCFRKKYFKNLIIRHTTSRKSAYARSSGEIIDHLNQLNTIYINKLPSYGDNKIYTNPPLKRDKTVLVIDDFCTQGYSLEAARIFIEKTGANVICLSLLKTIIKDYEQIVSIENFNPFQPNQFSSPGLILRHPYKNCVLSPSAYEEIGSKLQAYDNWQWPEGI